MRASDRGSVDGASVTVQVIAPDGTATTLTGAANRRGQVTLSMKPKSGPGPYVVSVLGVSASNHDYDPTENAATSKTVRVR